MAVYAGSWRVVWLVLLSIMMIDPVRPLDCISIIPGSFNHPSCCTETKVDSDTIVPTFMVIPLANDVWQLDVNISWAKPQADNFNAYAFDLDYATLITTANSCRNQYQNYMITVTEWAYLADVPFGSSPYFILYTANQTAQVINAVPNDDKTIDFLDCYESTLSIAFCQTQDVKTASKPIGLSVESLVAEERRDGDPLRATVTVSWRPPVQINGDLVLAGFRASLVVNRKYHPSSTSVAVPESQRNYTDPFSLSFDRVFGDVEVNETYEVLFQVHAELLDKMCDPTCVVEGREATLRIDFNSLTWIDTTSMPIHTTDATSMPIHTTDGPTPPSNFQVYYLIGGAVLFLCVLLILYVSCRRCRHNMPDDPPVQFQRSHMESNLIKNTISKE